MIRTKSFGTIFLVVSAALAAASCGSSASSESADTTTTTEATTTVTEVTTTTEAPSTTAAAPAITASGLTGNAAALAEIVAAACADTNGLITTSDQLYAAKTELMATPDGAKYDVGYDNIEMHDLFWDFLYSYGTNSPTVPDGFDFQQDLCGVSADSLVQPIVDAGGSLDTLVPSSGSSDGSAAAGGPLTYRLHLLENKSGWEWDGTVTLTYQAGFSKDISQSPPGKAKLVSTMSSDVTMDFTGTQPGRTPPSVDPLTLTSYYDVPLNGLRTDRCVPPYNPTDSFLGFAATISCTAYNLGPVSGESVRNSNDDDEAAIDGFVAGITGVQPRAYVLDYKISFQAGFDYTQCSLVLFADGTLQNGSPNDCTVT